MWALVVAAFLAFVFSEVSVFSFLVLSCLLVFFCSLVLLSSCLVLSSCLLLPSCHCLRLDLTWPCVCLQAAARLTVVSGFHLAQAIQWKARSLSCLGWFCLGLGPVVPLLCSQCSTFSFILCLVHFLSFHLVLCTIVHFVLSDLTGTFPVLSGLRLLLWVSPYFIPLHLYWERYLPFVCPSVCEQFLNRVLWSILDESTDHF
jgi:hypothetical protein